MATVQEVQERIFGEINDPKSTIYLKVQKKEIERKAYLKSIEEQCLKDGLTQDEAEDIVYLVDKSLWGFGILDDLVNDPEISDIRLIDENTIRIKKLGKRLATNIRFASKQEYIRYIEFITNRNSTTISITNAAQVFTDKDSCETAILRFTLSSNLINTNECPTLLIRKILKDKKTFDVLINEGFCTYNEAEYFKRRWKEGHGILVCGPNGSGKTTFTNAVLEETPKDKSAVVIQESEELHCNTHPEMVFRKVIPPRSGSNISYSLKDLARLALMESFDIIIVGEVKGDEAADLSYATYTGSQSMTTVHSNSAKEGYEKIVDYALSAQPNRTREHFAKQLNSMNTVVYIDDYRVTEIYELVGYDKQSGEFIFNAVNVNGGEQCQY